MGYQMKKKMFYILVFLVILVWGTNLYFYFELQRPSIIYIKGPDETTTTTTLRENVTIIVSKFCNLSSDCSWQSTNCCPESAGAYWQCINLNESTIKCMGNILCPQFISPKPTTNCSCEGGKCVG